MGGAFSWKQNNARRVWLAPAAFEKVTNAPALTNYQGLPVWSFPDGSYTDVRAQFVAPPGWSTATFEAWFVNPTAAAGDVKMTYYYWDGGPPYAAGDDMSTGAIRTVNNMLTVLAQGIVQADSAALQTLAVSDEGVLPLSVGRSGGDASDTMAGAFYLLGVWAVRAS